jgi:hypothetical protein
MISEAFAIDQLERLMGMVGFPRGKDAGSYVKEMRKAIQCARTEAIAEGAVSGMLREFRRCPAVADIYETMSKENARGFDEPVFAQQHHRCARCQDCGHYGGHLPPNPYAGPWRWCDCIAGKERQEREPHLVEEENRVRETLLLRFPDGKPNLRKIPRIDPQELREDRYFGEF